MAKIGQKDDIIKFLIPEHKKCFFDTKISGTPDGTRWTPNLTSQFIFFKICPKRILKNRSSTRTRGHC